MIRKNWSNEKIFTRLVTNKTQKTFWDNISELRSRPNQKVYNYAYSLAKSSIDKEKIIGIYVLAQLGFNPRLNQQKTVNLYKKLLLKEQSQKVLIAILSSISHNNDHLSEAFITKLTNYKNHRYSAVRFQLTLALCGIENTIAIATLVELTEDKNAEIRDWATFAIGSQIETNNKLIIDTLWKVLNTNDDATFFEAIAGLAQRKDNRIKNILIKELENIDNFSSLILDSIENLNDKDFIPLLEKKIKTNKKSKKINEKYLVDCLQKLKDNIKN